MVRTIVETLSNKLSLPNVMPDIALFRLLAKQQCPTRCRILMCEIYLTSDGFTPGGSSTVHIYKIKAIHGTTQWDRIHRTERNNNKNT
jgi:hypothetical protein